MKTCLFATLLAYSSVAAATRCELSRVRLEYCKNEAMMRRGARGRADIRGLGSRELRVAETFRLVARLGSRVTYNSNHPCGLALLTRYLQAQRHNLTTVTHGRRRYMLASEIRTCSLASNWSSDRVAPGISRAQRRSCSSKGRGADSTSCQEAARREQCCRILAQLLADRLKSRGTRRACQIGVGASGDPLPAHWTQRSTSRAAPHVAAWLRGQPRQQSLLNLTSHASHR